MKHLLSLFAILLVSCASNPTSQSRKTRPALRPLNANGDIFNDHYNPSNQRYTNTDTGLHIRFSSEWMVFAHFRQFPSALQATATKLRKSDQGSGLNGEMVLLARTTDQMLLFRVITEETNLSLAHYYSIIRAVNNDLPIRDESKEYATLPNGQKAVLWQYSIAQNGRTYRFIEYQILHNGFNSRLTFWTIDALMPEKQPSIRTLLPNILPRAL